MEPTLEPTNDPTSDPTIDPTVDPTSDPTIDPTNDPTTDPTRNPTYDPTIEPTTDPTSDPTIDPTVDPTFQPTLNPTSEPTIEPTLNPTTDPTDDPTTDPTRDPTNSPSFSPTSAPSSAPSRAPTEECLSMIVNIRKIFENGQQVNDSNSIIHEHWNGHYFEDNSTLHFDRPQWKKGSSIIRWKKPSSWSIYSGISQHELIYLNDKGLHPPTGQASIWYYYLDYNVSVEIELECSDSLAPTAAPSYSPSNFPSQPPTSFPSQAPSYSNDSLPTESATEISTPINTMNFFDEPDPNQSHYHHLQESSASPPPPSVGNMTSDHTKLGIFAYNRVYNESNTDLCDCRPVDIIPEDTEKDEYRDNDDDNEAFNKLVEQNEDDNIIKLESDLEAIKLKLDAIKMENMILNEKMEKSVQLTSMTAEYDKKIMEYDDEFHAQQRIIEEEERLIAKYQKEFDDKLAEHNINASEIQSSDHTIRNAKNGSKHAPQSSIVLYDNSFAINHQLQLEIDKLSEQIEWLQTSKIKLVKNTAAEVDRLRGIIKQFQGN